MNTSCFDYLRNKHIIEIISTKHGNKFNKEYENLLKIFVDNIILVMKKYLNIQKVNINVDDTKYFIFKDNELDVETFYICVTNKLNKEFINDVIKVVSINGVR